MSLYSWNYTFIHDDNENENENMKMKLKMKNTSHRYDRSRHGQNYHKYRKCLSMVRLTCIKQHPSNIWSSIHEKVKQN